MSEIYADIYFLINFSMDFICLFLTGMILGKQFKIRRLVLGAILGGTYSLLVLFVNFDGPLRFIITLLTAFIICYLAFGNITITVKAMRATFFSTFLFISVSFFMGGALTYLYSFLGKYLRSRGNSSDSSFLLLPASLLCGAFSYIVSKISKKSISAKKYEIQIITSKKQSFTALCDSGNLLCEPIGGLPVIILSKKASLTYISSGIFTPAEALNYPEISKKIRIIPVKGAVSGAILTGFIPIGGVCVEGEAKSCCVAFSDNLDFDGCECLLPSVLIT